MFRNTRSANAGEAIEITVLFAALHTSANSTRNKAMLTRPGHQTFWHGQGDGQEPVMCKLFNNFNHIWRTPPKAYARVRCRSNKPEKRELFAEQCARGTK